MIERMQRGDLTAARNVGLAGALIAEGALILLRRLQAHFKNRQVLKQLGVMSDHELADLGLLRTDLSDASVVTTRDDVGDFLERRRTDRSKRVQNTRDPISRRLQCGRAVDSFAITPKPKG